MIKLRVRSAASVVTKIVVDVSAAFDWSYLYMYLSGCVLFTTQLTQDIVSSGSIRTNIDRLGIDIKVYDLIIQYIPCGYVLSYDELYSDD